MSASQLAIEGGTPVRTEPLPSSDSISGRMMGDEEIKNLTEVIHSGHLFRYGGKFVVGFEQEFAKRYGMKHAVASTSGTAALHVAMGALRTNPGDEVIVSPITDMGGIIPVLFQGAIPIFADLEPDMYCMQPESIAENITDRTAAIIVVHLLGQTADMDPILEIARSKGIKVIEDCAQAYLTEYHGQLAGTVGDFGCFSLQQSKHMTAGDGGITITNDDDLAANARLFADKGWPRGGEARDYVFLGANYRMNELTGAVMLAQLRKLDGILADTRANQHMILDGIRKIQGITPRPVNDPEGDTGICIMFYLDDAEKVPEITAALQAEGIAASGRGRIAASTTTTHKNMPDWHVYDSWDHIINKGTPTPDGCPYICPLYKGDAPSHYTKSMCPNTLSYLNRTVHLDIPAQMTKADCEMVIKGIRKVAAAML